MTNDRKGDNREKDKSTPGDGKNNEMLEIERCWKSSPIRYRRLERTSSVNCESRSVAFPVSTAAASPSSPVDKEFTSLQMLAKIEETSP